MKVKIWATAVVAAAGLAFVPATASAASITAGHLTTSGGNSYTDSGAEFVHLTDVDGTNDDAITSLLLEDAGFSNQNTFGIYGFTQTGSGIAITDTLQVFSGAATDTSQARISFNVAAGKAWLGAGPQPVNPTLVKNIGANFGFYLSGPGGTFYSHSALNSGADQALMFDVRSEPTDEFKLADVVVAFEDSLNGDRDFNDMVVGVSDVTTVPEPGSMMLLGTGLFGLAGVARKKFGRAVAQETA
jgi:hypothetical protein